MNINEIFNIPAGVDVKAVLEESLTARLIGQVHSYTSQGGGGLIGLRVAVPLAKCVFDPMYSKGVDMKAVVATGAAWQVLYLYDKGLRFKEGKGFSTFWNGSASLAADRELGVSTEELKAAWSAAKNEWVQFDGLQWTADIAEEFVDTKNFKEAVLDSFDGCATLDRREFKILNGIYIAAVDYDWRCEDEVA